MTAIGTIAFDLTDGLDSGIALLLIKRPKQEVRFKYYDCVLLASPETPFVVCRFKGAHSQVEAYNQGTFLLQEALDVMSMIGSVDLVTHKAKDEYFVWWKTLAAHTLAHVTTITFPVQHGQVNITVKDPQGNVEPPNQRMPKHHIGFRFFRHSQASDDLYDAYRNMYLAFESLLSSRYPKTQRHEIAWFRESLTAALTDGLSLDDLASDGTTETISRILNLIYDEARLPLFHAKDDKAHFAPAHKAGDREKVVEALTALTHIVTRMADIWYSARRFSGWVNPKTFEDLNRTLSSDANFVFSDNPRFALHDDLDSETIKNGVRFPAIFSDYLCADYRPNIIGQLQVSTLEERDSLHALYLVNDARRLIGICPETTVHLHGFDTFQIRLIIRGLDSSAPKYIYPQ